MTIRRFAPLVLVAALGACASRPAPPLDQQAYVWQRQWTPAQAAAIAAMRGDFAAWRVLAAESDAQGEIVAAAPRLDLLAHEGKPAIAVLRIDGSRPPPSALALAPRIAAIASDWRGAGVDLVGIEIDHDCATAQLDEYAGLLVQLHARLPAGLSLSITALPTWIGSPALPRVLGEVDASVLQLHAIAAPRAGRGGAGLFDAAQAQRWIDAYAAVAAKPFRVALPAYGVRVGFDEDGRAVAVEGEAPRAMAASSVRELRADPREVAGLLRKIERAPPPTLAGVVWFRLPSEDDRRAWSAATLHAVIVGAEPKADFAVRVEAAADGASDVVLVNRGTLDAAPPATVELVANGCGAADALAGWRVEKTRRGWRFFTDVDAILRAGHERRIGWARCQWIERASVDADS